jgi:hypothetical protein
MTAQNVRNRGGCEKIFLLQPQFLAQEGGVIGVKHPADGARQRLGFGGGGEIAAIEPRQIELVGCPGRP